jgi:hypothetical protein
LEKPLYFVDPVKLYVQKHQRGHVKAKEYRVAYRQRLIHHSSPVWGGVSLIIPFHFRSQNNGTQRAQKITSTETDTAKNPSNKRQSSSVVLNPSMKVSISFFLGYSGGHFLFPFGVADTAKIIVYSINPLVQTDKTFQSI